MWYNNCLPFLFPADQKGNYDHIVVNDDLDLAYEYFKGLLIGVSSLPWYVKIINIDELSPFFIIFQEQNIAFFAAVS